MHIPDGIVPPIVAITGYAIAGGTLWSCLRQIDREKNPTEKIPKASLLTAAFFVTSLVHVPVPPASIHLIFNGLMGIVLGYFAFPAILVGLFFQAVFFQHGGLSTLGVNASMMGIPALLAYHFFTQGQRVEKTWWRNAIAFLAGAGALGLSALIFTGLVVTTIPAEINAELERNAVYAGLIGYSIQALLEGVFTVMVLGFLQRVKPEILQG